MKSYTVDFQPAGRRSECGAEDSILECSRRAGVGITSLCGGKGKCNACKVKILRGAVSNPAAAETTSFSNEELGQGWRLACQVFPLGDCSIGVPPESMTAPQRTQVDGVDIAVEPDPPVLFYKVDLAGPDLSDLTADADRLMRGLHDQHGLECRIVDHEVLHTLSADLRSLDWKCRVAVRGDEVISVGPWPGPHLGLAVDLGTTKIAAYLVDMSTGRRLASKGIMNPQISFGEDVITRIDAALRSETQYAEVQRVVVHALNELARDLCSECGSVPE